MRKPILSDSKPSPLRTGRRVLAMISILALGLSASSCGGASYFDVIKANSLFSQGRYQEAMVGYFHAEKRGRSTEWLVYDLGNVYYRLGEEGVAGTNWTKAAESRNAEVQFRSWFNRGVLAYEGGDFDAASGDFRKALEIRGSSIEAKINLELSLRSKNKQKAHSSQQPSPVERKYSPQSSENLLEFLSRKEHDQWKSQVDRQNDTSADY
jgi:Ca-activated chloride channel homolog